MTELAVFGMGYRYFLPGFGVAPFGSSIVA
jgi:hypothetical protein